MEKMLLLSMACACLVLLTAGVSAADRPWQYPVIKAAGPVVALPHAAVQPDPKIHYQVVFDISKGKAAQDQLVPGLAKVGRVINVFATGGMEPQKMKLALVMHGDATEAALAPAAYQEKHGFANPNLELLDQLSRAGVELFVCGQGLEEHHIAHSAVNPKITIALSALTVLTTYQLRGYAFMPF